MNRLRALVLLGWHFALHLLRKVTLTYRRGGAKRFRANYDPDRLLPVEPNDRATLAAWQRCTGCGLCEAVCAEAGLVTRGPHAGPMVLMTAGTRDLSALPAASSAAGDPGAGIPGAAEAAALCPVGVPIPDVIAFAHRQAGAARTAR